MFRSEKRLILAIEKLEKGLADMSFKVGEHESSIKRLELEWIETYDKIRHQLSRMARRGDLSNGKGPVETVDEVATEEPEMDPISAKIHARRSRTFLGRQ